MFFVIMRLIIISAIEDTIDLFLVDAIWLGAPNLHLVVLILENMTTIKRMDSFEHKASSWLECGGFPCSASTLVRRQSGLSRYCY
jgi:hypothetical protein